MTSETTPLRSTTSVKRGLSTPEDESEQKKNKLSDGQVLDTEADLSDISDLSIMADETHRAGGLAVGSVPSGPQITLKVTDLQAIAEILRDSFQPQLEGMVNTIVDGVLSGLNETIKTLQIENSALRKENQSLKDRVQKLETKMEAAEQYSRRNCLRIAGVPEDEAENTDVYVIDLSRAIDADVTLEDIDRSHRVGPIKDGRKRDIIVKFTSYRARRKLYTARTKTRECGYMGVFINEDLIKSRNKILLKARKMVKAGNLKSAWSSDGTILVRDKEDTKHRIVRESDLVTFGPVPKLKGELEQDASEASGAMVY